MYADLFSVYVDNRPVGFSLRKLEGRIVIDLLAQVERRARVQVYLESMLVPERCYRVCRNDCE